MNQTEPKQKLVVFSKDDCSPCVTLKSLMKIFSEIKGVAYEIEEITEETKEMYVSTFNLTSVPTVLHIYDGVEIGRFVGVKSPKEMSDFVEANLKSIGLEDND